MPDARINGRFTWWFETKTVRGEYDAEGHGRRQVRKHSELLSVEPDAQLFVLTPEAVRPAWFDGFEGPKGPIDEGVAARIIWLSFRQLAVTIEEIAGDPARLLGEQTRFLLSELTRLFEADGLLTNDDTVIVAARSAWPFYLDTGAYVCQPNRAFREGLTHLGFYADSAIQPLVPRIRQHRQAVIFSEAEADALRDAGEEELARLIEWSLDNGTQLEGEASGVFLLSPSGLRRDGQTRRPCRKRQHHLHGQTVGLDARPAIHQHRPPGEWRRAHERASGVGFARRGIGLSDLTWIRQRLAVRARASRSAVSHWHRWRPSGRSSRTRQPGRTGPGSSGPLANAKGVPHPTGLGRSDVWGLGGSRAGRRWSSGSPPRISAT